jgi:hypothetical protein
LREVFFHVISNHARRNKNKKINRRKKLTETIIMKFILSFLIVSTILSADTCVKLSVGNAALSDKVLCSPVNIFTPATPIKCLPVLQIPTVPTIKCDLPVVAMCPTPVSVKCTPAPIVCPHPVTPVIPCPPTSPKCPTTPVDPSTPSSATPEPASSALLGAGLLAMGVARRYRVRK